MTFAVIGLGRNERKAWSYVAHIKNGDPVNRSGADEWSAETCRGLPRVERRYGKEQGPSEA